MKDEYDAMQQDSPQKIKDKMYEIEVDTQAQNPKDESLIKINPRHNPRP
jgi:hypothetical protein